MQFEMGISTRRYLPASGTAGFERSLVSGNKRVPCPPPMITDSTLLVFGVWRLVYDITNRSVGLDPRVIYNRSRAGRASGIIASHLDKDAAARLSEPEGEHHP